MYARRVELALAGTARLARAAALASALLLAGCGHHEENRPAPQGSATQSTPPAPSRTDSTTAADSTSPSRAVAWIQDYYRAIQSHRYRDAYAHWEQNGRASGKSFEESEKGFAQTESVDVIVGAPGPVGAAAGSRYIEVPVRIVARTRDGSQETYAGSYTLRLNVVDGATPEQRTWHIYSANVRRQ